MCICGLLGEPQLRSDFFKSISLQEKHKDFAFANGQRLNPGLFYSWHLRVEKPKRLSFELDPIDAGRNWALGSTQPSLERLGGDLLIGVDLIVDWKVVRKGPEHLAWAIV